MTNSTDLNKTLDSEMRALIAKALNLQKGGIPGVKKSAPANQHYYRKHEVWDYEVERVVSTSYENAEEDITAILALIQTVGEGLLPEKKELLLSKEYATPRELLTHEQDIKLNTNHQIIGYNQAISDVRKAWGLKDV